jgi:hypothetical protein
MVVLGQLAQTHRLRCGAWRWSALFRHPALFRYRALARTRPCFGTARLRPVPHV